jgi:hypothetical protein
MLMSQLQGAGGFSPIEWYSAGCCIKLLQDANVFNSLLQDESELLSMAE